MPQKRNRVPDVVADGARRFLRVFFIFFLGFLVAHTETVRRIEGTDASEIVDSYLSNASESYDRQITVWNSVPNALQGGAVLIGPEFSKTLVLLLVGEEGRILHRWTIENGLFNPLLKQWWKGLADNGESAIDDAHLLPGGDVIFIQLVMSVNNYRGQRLARMDKDSHILWQVPGNFHHFIDIAGTPRKIYTLNSRLREGFPEVAPSHPSIRFLEDCIDVYSLDGKKIDEWSMVEAFEHSPYRSWLSSFEISLPIVQRIAQPDGRVLYDLFHMNSVQYLDAKKAKAIPGAQDGDLLVSFRTLNALAVFHPATKQIIWAAKGPWRHQHDAEVGDDGKLYIFDNEGRQAVTLFTAYGPPEQYISRLARYNPLNSQLDEIYSSPALYSYFLGNYQHLSNGSWIISSPLHGSVMAVSPDGKVTWELHTTPSRGTYVPHRKQISFMHYYPASAIASLTAPDDSAQPQKE